MRITNGKYNHFLLYLFNQQTAFSNASHVMLRQVPLSISGKYACEVSADAPSFHTSIVASEMEVVGKIMEHRTYLPTL